VSNFGIGTRLYGFCNGYFGRDSYGTKIVLAFGYRRGRLWIVADSEPYGDIVLATGVPEDLVGEWTEGDEE
jgi:hypothetical protein